MAKVRTLVEAVQLSLVVCSQPREGLTLCDCVAVTMKATEEVWTPVGMGYRIEQKLFSPSYLRISTKLLIECINT